MTKSRTLPALFLLIMAEPLPAIAQAGLPQDARPLPQPGTPDQPTIVTAEEAIEMDRARVHAILDRNCPPGLLDEDVVVCGRRPGFQRYRVPMAGPDVSEGTRERAGDAQLYAMEANDQSCSPVGRDQMCGGGIDLIGIGFTIVRGIAQALANRD
jgi:hypothetical protein